MQRWHRIFQRVGWPWVALLGAALVGGLDAGRREMTQRLLDEKAMHQQLRKTLEGVDVANEHARSLRELKMSDVEQFKAGISGQALNQKTLFEAGLSLQEERRLLEKQLEIMTTYLMINPSLQRVFLIRGDQPLQSYLIRYFPLRSFAGAPPVPAAVRIISKERFAHPERGKSEEVNGRLQWTPPQVGTSTRANALGQYVIFTNSRLILHGPPVDPEAHERYPHVCLGLDLDAARKLYRGSFIGTKIVLTGAPVVQVSSGTAWVP
jgi:hypothetical protein